jgi:serine/threonine protein kinase
MDKFLKVHPNISLPLKLSILLDVSYGLVYLHERNPPVVHRDLTARNILITDSYQAKVADLGMAKILDIQAQLATEHTQAPGQLFYMPPEVLQENASCTPQVDIFSFGHLTLYAVNQEFPKVHDITQTVTPDMQKQGIVERTKRQKAINQVQKDHCLRKTIISCLDDYPEKRPTTRELNRELINLNHDEVEVVIDVKETVESQREYIARLEMETAAAKAEVKLMSKPID